MPKPPARFNFSLDEIQRELDGLRVPGKKAPKLKLTEEQEEVLWRAQPGRDGGPTMIRWRDFVAWWRRKGWSGRESFLRVRLKDLNDKRGLPPGVE